MLYPANFLPDYVAWRPDLNAKDIDDFTLCWENIYGYAFPPFSVMDQPVAEGGELLVIAPVWATRPWFPWMLRMFKINIRHII
jgi:hypothetical protein